MFGCACVLLYILGVFFVCSLSVLRQRSVCERNPVFIFSRGGVVVEALLSAMLNFFRF